MAFNPFDVFRRNQRILFAMLTVVIMFMFVLSSGIGGKTDFFDWLPSVLARKVQSGDIMAVVDGEDVYDSELSRLNVNRILANEFMSTAAAVATDKLAQEFTSQIDTAGPDNRQLFQEIAQSRPLYIPRDLMMAVMMGRIPQNLIQQFQQESLARMQTSLSRIVTTKDAKTEDVNLAKMALELMELDQRAASISRGLYFANQPNSTPRDQMDFYLWRLKADELGIRFTDDDIQTLIKDEFHHRLTNADWQQVETAMGRKEGYSPESLRKALGDEFRVRLTQVGVMGQANALPTAAGQDYSAPYEYYEYYREQLSPTRYGVITVPAQNYLDQVTGEPTESELVELFKKHARAEPNPFSPTPGFKEPRRLKVSWLEVTGEEPYYKTAAEKVFPSSGPMPDPLLAVAGGAAAPPEVLLQGAYTQYKDKTQKSLNSEWFTSVISSFVNLHLVDQSVIRTQNLAAAAGAIAGSLMTGGTPFNPALTLEQTAIALDFQGRAKALAALLSPGLAVGDRIAATGAFLASLPQPLPLSVVQPELVQNVRKELAYQIAADDLQEFQTELSKLGEKLTKPGADATAAREYVEKFIKERGLKSGATEEFHDQFAMGEDPNLARLKEKAAGPHGGSTDAIQFGRRFFFEAKPGAQRETPTEGLFQPGSYPSPMLTGPQDGDSAIMVWRTAEIEENTPKSLDAKGVREKVVAAWKLQKAKELAKKAAEEIAKKAEKLGDNSTTIGQGLIDLEQELINQFDSPEKKGRVNYFEIDQVSPLVKSSLNFRSTVAPFSVTRNDNVPYPSQEMAQKLVENREKPPSTPIVMANGPQDTYYVAVVMSRDPKSDMEFISDIYESGTTFGAEVKTEVGQRYQTQLMLQARRQAVELLQAEFNYKDENPKLNEAN